MSPFQISLIWMIVLIWCSFISQNLLALIGGALVFLTELIACVVISIRIFPKINRTNDLFTKFFYISVAFIVVYSLISLIGFRYRTVRILPLLNILTSHEIYSLIFIVIIVGTLTAAVKKLQPNDIIKCSTTIRTVFIAVAIVNIITVVINPNLQKAQVYSTESGSAYVLGFHLAIALVLLLPIYFFKISKNLLKSILVILIISISVYKASFLISISGIFVEALVYYILSRSKKVWRAISIIVLTVSVFLAISMGLIPFVLNYIAENSSSKFLVIRANEILQFISGGANLDRVNPGNTTYRFVLYIRSWNGFIQHPLLGSYISGNYNATSGHSTVLDIMSSGGIGLFIMFFSCLSYAYKYLSSLLNNIESKRILLSVFITYFYFSLFNPTLSYQILAVPFFAVPVVLMSKELEDQSLLESKK